jgi:predicted RNA-binding protein YlxR (DUF448 family)
MNSKKIPQRTCVACRSVSGKRELIRLVRQTEGNVVVDTSGRLSGRGAYLCRNGACWRAGLDGKKLESALRIQLAQADKERLMAEGQSLVGDN